MVKQLPRILYLKFTMDICGKCMLTWKWKCDILGGEVSAISRLDICLIVLQHSGTENDILLL